MRVAFVLSTRSVRGRIGQRGLHRPPLLGCDHLVHAAMRQLRARPLDPLQPVGRGRMRGQEAQLGPSRRSPSYALERAGILLNVATIGGKSWYAEGARFILETQQPDGSWTARSKGMPPDHPVWDTCFAILFWKRATRPLEPVASVDRYVLKEEK